MKNTIKRLPVNLTIPFLTEVCLLFNVHKFAEIFSFDVMTYSAQSIVGFEQMLFIFSLAQISALNSL